MQKLSLVFLGSGPVAAASLASLVNDFHIEAVITKPKAPHYKGAAPVEVLAEQKGLRLLFAADRHELDALLSTTRFESKVGVVVDYGVIISEQAIAHFPLGIINSHFSLLPEWRGADPITFSVLSGQPKTGVSLMVIDAGLDTGKLITRKTIAIDPGETTPSLTDKLVTLSNQLLREYLPRYVSGEISPTAQPHPDRATHSRKLSKEDGVLDFTKPAEVLEREIRAFAGWPKSRATLGSLDVIITGAHVEPYAGNLNPGTLIAAKETLGVVTSSNLLAIDTVQPAGKKEMPVQAFLLGYRQKLN